MATVKIKYRASSVGTKEGTLFFQIIHSRVARQINTGYKLYDAEWDSGKGVTIVSKASDTVRRNYLLAVSAGIKLGIERLERIISSLEQTKKAYSADDVVNEYEKKIRQGGFVSFLRKHIEHLLKSNKHSAAKKLSSAMNSILRFANRAGGENQNKDDIAFEQIDSDYMEEYEGWLKMNGACMNTVSFYMRTLRAAYNIAAERGLTVVNDPFKNVYTGIEETIKRAVPLRVVSRIYHLDLTDAPELDYARNLFIFSFFMRGMSFVDMCNLRKSDLMDGVLSYRRQKTGQLMQVKWEKLMQQLLDKFPKTGSPYLLPIITNEIEDKKKQCDNALRKENRNLKAIGRMIGLNVPLTTYVARHSWASIARSQNISISAISEALGHISVNTTKIYITSLDTSIIDRANRKVLQALCRKQ